MNFCFSERPFPQMCPLFQEKISSGRSAFFPLSWLVVLGLTALWGSISVYIRPSPKEREKEERKDTFL